MIKTRSRKQQERQRLQDQLLFTLLRLSLPTASNAPPPETDWCTTRQLADAHNISIYKARIILLDMAKNGEVMVTPQRVNNTLRWYPSHHRTWRGFTIRTIPQQENKPPPE